MYYKDDFQIWVQDIFWTSARYLGKMSCLSEARCFACPSQKTITCSKLATETQKQGVNTI